MKRCEFFTFILPCFTPANNTHTHHSFPVYFIANKTIEVSGIFSAFQ
jgi:hypothetical protein